MLPGGLGAHLVSNVPSGREVKTRIGERGKLRLKNRILTNELTGDHF
jgi:hypothetical protein